MQTTNIWNMYHLSSKKVIHFFLAFILIGIGTTSSAQDYIRQHDEKRAENGFSYGIHLGVIDHNFRIERSATFLNQTHIRAIEGHSEPGVAIGIIGALHPSERLEIRATPSIAFNDEDLLYTIEDLEYKAIYQGSSTAFEIPMHLKYKSKPYGNFRMFLIGGGRFRTNFSADKKPDETSTTVQLAKTDLMFDIGAGAEIHFSYFTLAPTFTISQGFKNQRVRNDNSPYTEVLSGIYSRVYSIGFNIE